MHAAFGSQGDQVILIEKCRPWTDKAEVTTQDAPELRKLIQASAPQKPSDRCKKGGAVGEQMGCHLRSFKQHRPEFWHEENLVEATYAFRPVQRWTLGCETDEERDAEEQRKHDDEQQRSE